MSMEAAPVPIERNPLEQLRFGRQIVQAESQSLEELAKRLDGEFCRAVELIHGCRGSVIVSGMGKAGIIGQKIMATLASTGTPAHCLHPAEAVHGDLGRIRSDDVFLVLSQSGETAEVTRLLPSIVELGVPLVAITAHGDSTLGLAATVTIELGSMKEACALGLAPSTSTTAMLAVGDALALVVSRMRRFQREDFARFHPAGNLGLKLSRVEHHMRPAAQCRVASDSQTIREVLIAGRVPGRRSGATMLVDSQGRLSGVFTDSDLARLFEQRRDGDLDTPAKLVMTANPVTVTANSMMTDAVALMASRKISELPVVDPKRKPIGLIDITDVFGLMPKGEAQEDPLTAGTCVPKPFGETHPWRVFREPDGDKGA